MKFSWRTFGMIGALLLIALIFSVLTDGTFITPRNLALLSRQMAVTAMLATGMVLVIVAGQIDLSVGALTGLTGACAAILCVQGGMPVWASFALVLGLGALLGFLQGSLVTRLNIPPFIVTLGGMLIFQGMLLGITKGVAITPPSGFLLVGQMFIPPWLGWALAGVWTVIAVRQAWRHQAWVQWLVLAGLGLGSAAVMNAYEGIPLPVILMLALACVFWIVSAHTPFGRHLYAIGGNREAAYYSGIPIRARLTGTFTLMGLVSAAAGIVLTARVGSASSDAGRMMELDAIAAAVIGGASLMGGRGTVWGALLGAAVMASLDNGMSLLNTEAFWQPIIKGGILIVAVAADMWGRKNGRSG